MSLSDQERDLLAAIEQNLRWRDPAFARRIDALNAIPRRDGPQRYACHVSGWEIICILLTVIILATLLVFATLAAGSRTSTPSELPVRAPTGTGSGSVSSPLTGHRNVPTPQATFGDMNHAKRICFAGKMPGTGRPCGPAEEGPFMTGP
jgi:hypothetical protein